MRFEVIEFTATFCLYFGRVLYLVGPVLTVLVVLITTLGQVVGRFEGWSKSDALYYAFITATTVGYGDFHPGKRASKLMAIAIALVGLLLTGIIVAVGLKAIELTIMELYPQEQLLELFGR